MSSTFVIPLCNSLQELTKLEAAVILYYSYFKRSYTSETRKTASYLVAFFLLASVQVCQDI